MRLSLVGFTATTLLNQYSPCSFGKSILLYTISQVPALLYILATTEIKHSLLFEFNQKEMEFSIIKKEAVIRGQQKKICAAKCLAWLNNPKDPPVLDSSSLDDAYQMVYSAGKNNAGVIQ